MQENVGNVERWLRVAVGGALVLGSLRTLGQRWALGPGLLLAGGAMLLETAFTRVCPVNAALGIDTHAWDDEVRRLTAAASGESDEPQTPDADIAGAKAETVT